MLKKRNFLFNIEANKVLPVALTLLLVIATLQGFMLFSPNRGIVKSAPSTTDFDDYINLTINNVQVDGSHTNFPLLVYNASTTVLSGLDSNDFTFFNTAGTELYWELVEWNDPVLEAWVKLNETVDGGETIQLWYGADDTNNMGGENSPTSVWNSNYMLVMHMNGATSNDVDDSTSNNNDVSGSGGSPHYEETGQVGDCIRFDGDGADNGDHLSLGDSSTLSFGDGADDDPLTMNVWVNSDDHTTDQTTILSKYDATYNREYQLQLRSDGTRLTLVDSSANKVIYGNSASLSTDTWHMVTATYDGSEAHTGIQNYHNGESVSTTTSNPSPTYTAMEDETCAFNIGRRTDDNNYMDGHIDEIFISNVQRSAGWINTMYNQMYNKTSFYTWDDTGDVAYSGVYTYSGLENSNGQFTFRGLAGSMVWANDSTDGTVAETMAIHTNLSGTNENTTAIHLDFSTWINNDIDEERLNITVSRTVVGFTNNVYQVPDGGNVTINSAVWDAQSWCAGTNPFPIDNTNVTFYVRVRQSIPSGVSPDTYEVTTAQGKCFVKWYSIV